MTTATIYAVRATKAAGEAYARNHYNDGFRGDYSLVSQPRVGDVVFDVLTVTVHGDKYQIDSAAAFGTDVKLAVEACAAWGDQYEPGAEIYLRDAAVSALFYPRESSPHYNVATGEFGALSWLRWMLVPCTDAEAGFQIFGEYLAESVSEATTNS